MAAEWKKRALDRAKRKDELAEARAAAEHWRNKYQEATRDAEFVRTQYAKTVQALHAGRTREARYIHLRSVGILIEDAGEFKFLQHEDLDNYFAERLKHTAAAQAQASGSYTPPSIFGNNPMLRHDMQAFVNAVMQDKNPGGANGSNT